jgi:hypothetical protein
LFVYENIETKKRSLREKEKNMRTNRTMKGKTKGDCNEIGMQSVINQIQWGQDCGRSLRHNLA